MALAASDPSPPEIANDAVYTRYWCEENIYHLAKTFQSLDVKDVWSIYAVFISNPTKSVALWRQRLGAAQPRNPVIWDYHVVLVASAGAKELSSRDTGRQKVSWIYDFDTTLPMPCPAEEYVKETFMLHHAIPEQYRSMFRVVPADELLRHFASDRSHMIIPGEVVAAAEEVLYSASPPVYSPIQGPTAMEQGVSNNLMDEFVSMSAAEKSYGRVMDVDAFLKEFV